MSVRDMASNRNNYNVDYQGVIRMCVCDMAFS